MQRVDLPYTILSQNVRAKLFDLQNRGVLDYAIVGGSLALNTAGIIHRKIHDIDLVVGIEVPIDTINDIRDEMNKIAKSIMENGIANAANDTVVEHSRWQYEDGTLVCLFIRPTVINSTGPYIIPDTQYPVSFRIMSLQDIMASKWAISQNKSADSSQKLKHKRDITSFYRNIGHTNFK